MRNPTRAHTNMHTATMRVSQLLLPFNTKEGCSNRNKCCAGGPGRRRRTTAGVGSDAVAAAAVPCVNADDVTLTSRQPKSPFQGNVPRPLIMDSGFSPLTTSAKTTDFMCAGHQKGEKLF